MIIEYQMGMFGGDQAFHDADDADEERADLTDRTGPAQREKREEE